MLCSLPYQIGNVCKTSHEYNLMFSYLSAIKWYGNESNKWWESFWLSWSMLTGHYQGWFKLMTREGNCLLNFKWYWNATHYTRHTCFLPMMGTGKFSPGAFVLSILPGQSIMELQLWCMFNNWIQHVLLNHFKNQSHYNFYFISFIRVYLHKTF